MVLPEHERQKNKEDDIVVPRIEDMRFRQSYDTTIRNKDDSFLHVIQNRDRERGTWRQRSQVKGKKSICLQISTEQCFPRSGNSGVPIGSDRETELLTIPTRTKKEPKRLKKKKLNSKVYQARENRVIRIRVFRNS